ncbi:glycosyltransferase family 2 protein [Oceanicola sp. 22II-s10i]|uniref:glycosyltransferase family 2 protein n=1 Tax=Oceanicola sp. 22II-s10i TaxID=1317116 RepID=UPI000B51E98D|nr:glycosyltransferase family 2 protein [Oceanicola sp. 22II-s10i]
MIRLSVIIPLYNKRRTVLRAIDSVLGPECPDGVELIVVDDGSTDGSAEIAESRKDDRMRIVRQANAGPAAARNAGARLASAPVLSFLDADDEWCNGFACAGLAALDAHPDCVAYVSGYDAGAYAHKRNNKVRALGLDGPAGPVYRYDPPRWKQLVDALHSSCVMVRRGVFERFGGYYDAERAMYGEDSPLWAQVLLAGQIYWDPAERLYFHVEDSDLGFAVRRRTGPRPITRLGAQLIAARSGAAADAMRGIVAEIAEDDLRQMSRSGIVGRTLRLRRAHGLVSPAATAGDLFRAACYHAMRPFRSA